MQKSKRVSISDEKEGLFSLGNMKYFFGEIILLPLKGMEKYAEKIQYYLNEIADDVDVSIINVDLLRFKTGDAKAVLNESVRGKDVYIVVDMGNYSETYNIHGYENHMSPDEHYMDLMRTISAIGGKAARINVISPLLYSARQDRRIARESLDCAVALQDLYSVGVSNVMVFDVHDDRVQNAVPFMGFDKLMPVYQAIKALCNVYPDVLVIDDIIASGDTILDVAQQLSDLGAKRIFIIATFGFFTKGTHRFDEAYNSGILEAVFITNASYVSEEITSSPWYREIDVIKYISYYIYCVNSGSSIAKLIDPHKKTHDYLRDRNAEWGDSVM